jgi:hypothetical protein
MARIIEKWGNVLSTELQDLHHSNESLGQAVSVLKYEVLLMFGRRSQ